jgi:two-component system, OmpR family, phosphate regulon sensor histidine kinase PhoR
MRHQIRWRILLPYLILLVLTAIILSILLIQSVHRSEEILWKNEFLRTAQRIAVEAQSDYGTQGEKLLLSRLAERFSNILALSITFLDMDGNILGSSLPPDQLPVNPFALPALEEGLAEGQAIVVKEGMIAATVVIQGNSDEPLGIVHIQGAKDTFEEQPERILGITLVVILVSALMMVILFSFFEEKMLRPTEMLTIAAEQISMRNFTNLEFPKNPQGLADLSQALQAMAQQLDEQFNTLSSERTLLSAVLKQMTDGVLIADADGRVQMLNPTAERLFQIKEDSGAGRSIVEVLRYHQLVDLWRLAKTGQRQSTMLEIGPQHLFLQVVGIPLKTSLPGSTMLLFQDLTQLRRLETVRRDFISNVSHELRTPLASLKALVDTLREGALDDPPAAHRFLLRMETEIDNLAQLVTELLELSRIESGKVPVSFHRMSPYELLKPGFERMVLQAERAGLELSFDCPPDLPLVFADPDRITQVMINLIHNAIKFTPPSGKITISAYQDGEQIVFFVQDTGVGIARKDLGRIFERFYKADQARSGGGTGLGLSIARHMIELHGGYIWAESEEGMGSTLYFTLPIA